MWAARHEVDILLPSHCCSCFTAFFLRKVSIFAGVSVAFQFGKIGIFVTRLKLNHTYSCRRPIKTLCAGTSSLACSSYWVCWLSCGGGILPTGPWNEFWQPSYLWPSAPSCVTEGQPKDGIQRKASAVLDPPCRTSAFKWFFRPMMKYIPWHGWVAHWVHLPANSLDLTEFNNVCSNSLPWSHCRQSFPRPPSRWIPLDGHAAEWAPCSVSNITSPAYSCFPGQSRGQAAISSLNISPMLLTTLRTQSANGDKRSIPFAVIQACN